MIGKIPSYFVYRLEYIIRKSFSAVNSGFEVLQKAEDYTTKVYDVPLSIARPDYAVGQKNKLFNALKYVKAFKKSNDVKSDDMIARICKACRIGRYVLNHVKLITEVLMFLFIYLIFCKIHSYVDYNVTWSRCYFSNECVYSTNMLIT